ncbi:MAG TPA: TraM recognition domain-containing protein [Yinghuangia sp.]|nr:TraM recognition domain-containing protein [Yinghuangia sp.]
MPATLRRRGPDPNAPQLFLLAVSAVAGTIVLAVWLRSALVLLLGGLVGAGVAAIVLIVRYIQGRRPEIDRTARYLAKPTQVRSLTTRGATEAAARLGAQTSVPGVPIGESVRGGRALWGSWEDMHMDIWGPRTGKTATRAIPAVVSAPGAVVVTSNKRDIVDATRGVRERRGPVWVFDPQSQANEPASWWWNPLTFVNNNVGRAMILAGLFAGINRPAHARSDGYFEPAGQDLFAAMLLAACADDLPITRVLTWLSRPNDDTPVRILRDAGHDLMAASMEAVVTAPALQRAGVYGTAAQIASPLVAPNVALWVTPGEGPRRPEFRHSEFAQRGDGTIYLLSEETNKAAAPLVVSLSTALAYELEGKAIESPGGRLPVPAIFVLDEAANVCPWPELPSLYTHYGSRGIVMMTIIQSWAQGAAVWGESGMSAMWGAANVRMYGGGSGDTKFLGDLSQVSPNFEATVNEMSFTNPWDAKQTIKSRSEEVFDPAVLGAMPRGRAWVQVSGAPPILVRTTPWWEGEHADAIRESLARYSPHPAADKGR